MDVLDRVHDGLLDVSIIVFLFVVRAARFGLLAVCWRRRVRRCRVAVDCRSRLLLVTLRGRLEDLFFRYLRHLAVPILI